MLLLLQVLKGEPGCSYGPKRSPAWCDRVLLKSALPHKRGSYSSYFASPDICTSDHKPVAAVLLLPLITDTVTSGRASARTPFKLYVAGLRLEGESTWRRLAELASHPSAQTTCPAAAAAAAAGGEEAEAAAVQQQQQCKPKVRKLQLVLSGACIAHKHQHVSADGGCCSGRCSCWLACLQLPVQSCGSAVPSVPVCMSSCCTCAAAGTQTWQL
jgi:hypothetical protein